MVDADIDRKKSSLYGICS